MTNLNFRFHAVCLSFISVKTNLRAGTQLLKTKKKHTHNNNLLDGCACINQLSSQHISYFSFLFGMSRCLLYLFLLYNKKSSFFFFFLSVYFFFILFFIFTNDMSYFHYFIHSNF